MGISVSSVSKNNNKQTNKTHRVMGFLVALSGLCPGLSSYFFKRIEVNSHVVYT